uniref:type II toxin-antitoxin system RelE/ParE family toxin n=1 Tax=uncultured Caulobacter sp. TaxID=158749 RepID=UPI00345C4E42
MAYRLSRKAEEDVVQIYFRAWRCSASIKPNATMKASNAPSSFSRNSRSRRQSAPSWNADHASTPFRSHIILYRLDGSDIFIQRVRHASEDWIG